MHRGKPDSCGIVFRSGRIRAEDLLGDSNPGWGSPEPRRTAYFARPAQGCARWRSISGKTAIVPHAIFRAAVLAVRTARLFPALGGARSHLLSFAARACSCWEPRPAAGKCAVDSCQRAHLFARACARVLLRRTASAASSQSPEIAHQPALLRAAMDCNRALAKALATDRGRPNLTIACDVR